MNYDALITAISEAHQQARAAAAGAVNRHLILRNWLIGAYLVEFEQNGEDRAQYGVGLLKRISADLRRHDIPGTSAQMLERMRLFYTHYPQMSSAISSSAMRISSTLLPARELAISSSPPVELADGGLPQIRQSLIGESATPELTAPVVRKSLSQPRPLPPDIVLRLSWTHLLEIIRLDDPWKRAFYENECLKGNWSVRQLQRQIGSLLYERTGLSTDKQAVIEHASQQAADAPAQIADLIRDPYVLEFTGLAAQPHYLESDLESALLGHLQSFLLELGTGFCFEARQKRITVGNEHDYLDLVFYHRLLRCHLLIDLKVRAFQHGDAGQMNFYLNYWKNEVMAEADSPPVGLLLCTDKDQTKVEYATAGLDHQLFVSRYLAALPKTEQLQQLIETDRAVWEQRHPEAQSRKEP